MKGEPDREHARLLALLEAAREPRGNGHSKTSGGPPTGLGALWKNARQISPSTGTPINNLWNALLALRNDPNWAGKLRYDEMRRSQVGGCGPLADHDIIPIHEWLQANGLNRIGLDVVREAVEAVCHEHPFHPLRQQLEKLEWDEVPRLAEWPVTYLGAPPGEPVHSIGTMFMTAMVARIFEPGCKADYMLVLEGPQGKKKSQACEILAGEYFSDQLPELGSTADHVRVSMHLRGKWLIEVAELSSFSTADARKLKSFLSARVERFTPKFARFEVSEPRTCLFAGTTNDDHYLRDPTGGRRFWPVKCGNIDLDGLRLVRDQLLAEAVHSYRMNIPWWPEDNFEDIYLKPLQDSRYEADAWEQPILDALVGKNRITTFEVARDYLRLPESQIGTAAARRIAAVLRQAGWTLVRDMKSRFWIRP